MLTVHSILLQICASILRSSRRICSDYTIFSLCFQGKAEYFYLKKKKKSVNDIGNFEIASLWQVSKLRI